MPCLKRLARHGRLAALIAMVCPTLQDAITEAFTNAFTEHVPIPASSWLAIPLSLLVSAVLEKLPGLVSRLRRARGGGRPAAAAGPASRPLPSCVLSGARSFPE